MDSIETAAIRAQYEKNSPGYEPVFECDVVNRTLQNAGRIDRACIFPWKNSQYRLIVTSLNAPQDHSLFEDVTLSEAEYVQFLNLKDEIHWQDDYFPDEAQGDIWNVIFEDACFCGCGLYPKDYDKQMETVWNLVRQAVQSHPSNIPEALKDQYASFPDAVRFWKENANQQQAL